MFKWTEDRRNSKVKHDTTQTQNNTILFFEEENYSDTIFVKNNYLCFYIVFRVLGVKLHLNLHNEGLFWEDRFVFFLRGCLSMYL